MKYLSWALIVTGLAVLWFIFGPVVTREVKYTFDQALHVRYSLNTTDETAFDKPLVPPNTDFSIVIPKIAAVAPIISNVDPTNPQKYLPALKKGVAQAAGTALPDSEGNVYLFAHSTDAFYNVNTYNAVFYLIGKLAPGDEIDIFYKDKLIKYEVYDKKVVDAGSTQYLGKLTGALNPSGAEKTLTLQTCYPPGTTLRRLIVIAKEVNP